MSSHLSDEQKRVILNLHAQGDLNIKIAQELGVSETTIGKYLKKSGLKTNFPHDPIQCRDGRYLCDECSQWLSVEQFELGCSSKPRRACCKKCRSKQAHVRHEQTYQSYIAGVRNKAKYRAKKKSIPFNVSTEYLIRLWDLQKGCCFLTDQKMLLQNSDRRLSGSIDRIIPFLGYIPGNLIWLVNRVNMMKSDVTLEEMSLWMPFWFERIRNKIETDSDSWSLRLYLPKTNRIETLKAGIPRRTINVRRTAIFIRPSTRARRRIR